MQLIEFKNISKVFNHGTTNEISALLDINIEIGKGEFVALIGSNGSGKSTLLNVLAGSVSLDSGSVIVDGDDITHFKEHQRGKWVARIFQNPLSGTAPNMTVLENFRLAALRTQQKGLKIGIDDTFINKVKEKVSYLGMGLENRLDQKTGNLSGGQRQALTLMMAVMDDAKILLMDEPTAALDPRSSEVLLKTASTVIEMYQLTCIFVTHQLKDAHLYGNRLLQMEEGRIIRDLKAEEKQETALTEYFRWFA